MLRWHRSKADPDEKVVLQKPSSPDDYVGSSQRRDELPNRSQTATSQQPPQIIVSIYHKDTYNIHLQSKHGQFSVREIARPGMPTAHKKTILKIVKIVYLSPLIGSASPLSAVMGADREGSA